jgi:translocation and assembly module TamB
VRLTADGVPIVFHDTTLTRATGGADERAVHKVAYADLPRLRGGERIPRLDEALDAMRDRLVNVELKADVTYEHQAPGNYMSGSVEVVRGFVEPLSDRRFEVKRGRLTFTGGPPKAAIIDAEAEYDDTSNNVVVTVTVSGPVVKPQISLRSQPAMDEGKIAMLIATGRTELKANSGGVGMTEEATTAATAAASAFLVDEFRKLVADKLPVDSVQIDASQLRAGKYLTDKLYVGYTYRRNAAAEKGENTNELRLEYQITPRWTLEGRGGDAGTGGGSLIWSKDY